MRLNQIESDWIRLNPIKSTIIIHFYRSNLRKSPSFWGDTSKTLAFEPLAPGACPGPHFLTWLDRDLHGQGDLGSRSPWLHWQKLDPSAVKNGSMAGKFLAYFAQIAAFTDKGRRQTRASLPRVRSNSPTLLRKWEEYLHQQIFRYTLC